MNSKTQYRIIAVLICIVIYALYISLSVSMDWGHGGGYLVLVVLVGVLRAVWKGVNNLADEKDKTNETPAAPQEEALPEIPTDAEAEQLSVEEESPIPVENVAESIQQEESEYLPPIPIDIEEETIVSELSPIPLEENNPTNSNVEAIENQLSIASQNNTPTTHWQKYKLYYIIGACLSIVLAVVAPISMYINNAKEQKKINDLVIEAKRATLNSYYDLAIKKSQEALTMDSCNLGANYVMAMALFRKNEYAKAISYLDLVYSENSQREDFVVGDDTVSFNKVFYWSCSARLNNPEIKGVPKDLYTHDRNELMAMSQEYISLYPEDANAYRCMVLTYLKLANKRKAKDWANQMVEKFPENNDSYFCLAYVLSEMGNNREAIKNYKKCIEISPKHSSAYNNLGCCYSDIGQYQTAYKYWRKSVEIDNNETAIGNLESHGQSY